MSGERPAIVFNTDKAWFDHFRPQDALRVVDEVNFWRPAARASFRALQPGEPLFFRLKSPYLAIAGFGFFAVESTMSVSMAWEVFGEKNGDPTRERFESRIAGYRMKFGRPLTDLVDQKLSCLILRDATFLPTEEWVAWDRRNGWSPNIVSFKGYDLGEERFPLSEMLSAIHPEQVPDLASEYSPLTVDDRTMALQPLAVREGQGSFRVRLLKAYGQCSITGEHSVPVLDAAHIQPYLGPASNHVQNGLILRSDLHRLFDAGYLTVTPDFRVEVSRRLREEFDNGRVYYQMAGAAVHLPDRAELRPSKAALEWHASNVFH